MSYTFLDQQNKLSNLLGDSDTSTESMWPLATRKKEINRGEINFARDSKILREYASGTLDSTKEITIPSDWMETFVFTVDNKTVSNKREISLADWTRYQDWNGTEPYWYFWEFSGVRKIKLLGNVNGLSYQLFYFQKPTTELSDDTDTSLLPEEYREGPVFYAASELLTTIGKTELADYMFGKYQVWVNKAKADVEKQHIDKRYAVPDFGDLTEDTETDRVGKPGFTVGY